MRGIVIAAIVAGMLLLPHGGRAGGPAPEDGAIAPDTPVVWSLPETPPAVILTGPLAGTGIVETVQRMIVAATPDIAHGSIRFEPTVRALRHVAAGEPVCRIGLILTADREKRLIFSDVLYYSLPSRLHVSGNGVGPDNGAEVDLTGYLSGGPRLAMEIDRAYGAEIDEAIRKGAPRIERVRSSLSGLSMLASGSVDAVIEYPGVAEFHRRSGAPLPLFRLLRIAGTALIPVTVGCTRSTWGRRVIDRINAALRDQGGLIGQQVYLDWLERDVAEDLRRELIRRGIAPPVTTPPDRPPAPPDIVPGG